MVYESVNPLSGKRSKIFNTLSDEELEVKIDTSVLCFKKWKATSFEERAHVVNRAAHLLHSRLEKFARLSTLEMGKLIEEARGEVQYCVEILKYYARNAEDILVPLKLHPRHGHAYIERSPLGVIFAIEPGNFPYYQMARIAGPQLMAGNTVLMKQASHVPQCALEFEKIWSEAGAPEGLYTNLFVTLEQSDRLLQEPRIKGVKTTGRLKESYSISNRNGKTITGAASELGGSDAFIVLEDADLQQTIPWAVWGCMYNGGQTCIGSKRFIVVDSIAEKFLSLFKNALAGLKVGDPMDEKTMHGPLSSESDLLKLLTQVDLAVTHGAQIELGGQRIERQGSFMQTTLLRNVLPSNPA